MSIGTRLSVTGLFILALCAVPSLFAQQPTQQSGQPASPAVTTARLDGVVRDKDGGSIPGATVVLLNTQTGVKAPVVVTNASGAYSFAGLTPGLYKVTISMAGFKTVEFETRLTSGTTTTIPTTLEIGMRAEVVNVTAASELVRTETPTKQTSTADFLQTLPKSDRGVPAAAPVAAAGGGGRGGGAGATVAGVTIDGVRSSGFFSSSAQRLDAVEEVTMRSAGSGETYSRFQPNPFNATIDRPLSTFGADVDTASYSNIRRFLSNGQLPPSEAVRVEELVNYFRFAYASPRDGQPIALTTEIGDCPWAPSHKLVLIGARAAAPVTREITGRNIVLLIDVSGSMAPPERLPLIKTALGLFVDTLRPDDTLAIVTYAGSSGIVLNPTPARYRDNIQRAIASLNAGGSTNGGEGLVLAYRTARQAFKRGGVNRVILATDGDFNVGVTSQQDLMNLIEQERESGVFLSVFGVGTGNLKDRTMEMLADRGNGNYAYLDSLQEARRVLIKEGDATLEAVAKDVKFQVEFNPAIVYAWKLIGYENRALAARDFNNDRKDAGEMGAGHTVTVLYEVIPEGVDRPIDDRGTDRPEVDPLRYQQQPERSVVRPVVRPNPAAANGEWLTVKARYKLPESDTSDLMTKAVRLGGQQHLPLAAAVAEFGLLLRDDPRNIDRWTALSRRLDRLSVPAGLASEVDGFKELVATASGLARIR
jgi:Ca-activated chloride channel family protein